MSKALSPFRSRRRAAAMSIASDSPVRVRGVDGQYLDKGVSVRSLAVVVVETRQQRRYSAQQAAKGVKA